MIYRSKAPLRIGLAGGGTDVSPTVIYMRRNSSMHGVLNAYANIEITDGEEVHFESIDYKQNRL